MKKILAISIILLSTIFTQINLSFDNVNIISDDYICEPSGEDVGASGQSCDMILNVFGFTCVQEFAGAPLTEICPLTCFDEANCPDPGTGSLSVMYTYEPTSSEVLFSGFQFDLVGITITDSGGGAAEDQNFTLSDNGVTILGFSSSGNAIPAANNAVLVNIDFEDYQGGDICFGTDDDGSFSGTNSDNSGGDIFTTSTCYTTTVECAEGS